MPILGLCALEDDAARSGGLLAEARRNPRRWQARVSGHAGLGPGGPTYKREATDNWDDRVAVERFESKGGRFLRGWARLDGPGEESWVGDRELRGLDEPW